MKIASKDDFAPNAKELEALLEQHKTTFSDEIIREHATEDAKKEIPSMDATAPSAYEQKLTHTTSTLSSQLVAKFRSSLDIVDAKIRAEEGHIKAEHQHEVEKINNLYDLDLEASENAFGLSDAHSQLQTAEKRFNEMYSRFGRGPVYYMPHWLYLVFAIAIFLGEVPLNAMVFEVFGENQVMTWVMALIIGLSIPLTAHFIGIKLREHGEGFSWPNTIKAFLTFALITVALYGLSEMRQSYLEGNRETFGLDQNIIEASFNFFWLNMAVFLTAIVVAYLAHDSVPGFQDASNDKVVSRKSVEKQEKKRVTKLVKEGKKKALALSKANALYREKMISVVMLKGIYDQILADGQEYENRCNSLLGTQVSIYRQENLRQREGNQTPKSFSNQPSIELKLAHMKEKLENDS